MGNKSESKNIMINAGVPVTPGYHGNNNNNDILFNEAKKIGYPVLIKAVSGYNNNNNNDFICQIV